MTWAEGVIGVTNWGLVNGRCKQAAIVTPGVECRRELTWELHVLHVLCVLFNAVDKTD